MPGQDELRFRAAGHSDAPAIAALHTDSWQRHYRGAYADAFLDGDVTGFLLDKWTTRFAAPDPRARTILAELPRGGGAGGDRALVGMAHAILDHHQTLGALLDNLHVAHGLKRHGVGTRLMSLTAQAVMGQRPGSGLYLWVLEQNASARAFYDARGGTCVANGKVPPPGGDPDRLNGMPRALLYSWSNPATLLSARP